MLLLLEGKSKRDVGKRWKESITIDGKSGISHVKRVNNKRVLRKRSVMEKFYLLGHFV